jgi:hypothetical protein
MPEREPARDADVEALLRRYRPIGPPPRLRARVLSAASPRRAWPWATAAAVLLGSIVALHLAIGRLTAVAPVKPGPAPSARAIQDLADRLGGDAAAQHVAEFVVMKTPNEDDAFAALSGVTR